MQTMQYINRKEHLMNSMETGQNILQDRASYELDADRRTEHLNSMQKTQKTVDKQENRASVELISWS